MEKEYYSMADLLRIIAGKNIGVGSVVYYRDDELIKIWGSAYEIEFEIKILKISAKGMDVHVLRYWNGFKIVNDSFPHLIPKTSYGRIHKNSRFI